METVIVTGIRQSLAKGLEVKRESTQVVESIVAEDIGKLPDNNVVEALQRVTGVQITNRGGGEAGGGDPNVPGIYIRGLSDITTTWNGRNVFTGVGRALALQDIPANLINRVDVFKTRASEQIETGLAGQIDVRTRRPFDFAGFQMSLNARAVTQEQRGDEIDPNLSFLASNTWDLGNDSRFGALLNLSYGETRYRDQSATAGALVPFVTATGPRPAGFTPLQRVFNGTPPVWEAGTDRGLPTEPGSVLDFDTGPGTANFPYLLARDALFASDFEGDRKRPAANLALQFAPNESSEYTFEAFYQGYREIMFNNLHFTFADWWGSLRQPPEGTISLYPDTNLIKTRVVGAPFNFNSGDATWQNTNTYVYALNGKWEIGDKLRLEADVTFQESQFETTFLAVRTTRVPGEITLDFNAHDGIPSWHFTDGAGGNVDANMLNPAGWDMGQIFENNGHDLGSATTATIDGDYAFGDGAFRTLSFGVRYDDREAVHSQPVTSPAPEFPRVVPTVPIHLSEMPVGMLWTNKDFLDGSSLVPGQWVNVNGYWLRDHADEVRDMYNVQAGGPTPVRSYSVGEKTTSAYVQLDMQFGDKFTAQTGVRYTRVETPIEFTNLVDPNLAVTTAESTVSEFMPSVTLQYKVTDDFNLRANYGETLRRPNFDQLNPNFTLTQDLTNIGYGTGTGGNPDLTSAKGKNFDLTAEWYFAEGSAIYGTVFRREIDGLIVPFVQTLTIPGTGLNVDVFKVTRPVNASDGELEGIEFGFVYFPENLPGFLNGFGVQGSFTKLDSSQNIPAFDAAGNVVGEDTSEFFGVSDFSYNVTLAYERFGLGARLSYVWRDDFIARNEARLFANPIGIWHKPEASLDLQLNYDFNEHLGISFDAVNLTEDMEQSYYAFADAGGPQMFNFGNVVLSRSFALGVRWKF